MIKLSFQIFAFVFFINFGFSQDNSKIYEILNEEDSSYSYYIGDKQLFTESWDALAQPIFWKKIMVLSPDSCIINVAETREILLKTSFVEWKKQTEEEKDVFRDSIRYINCLDSNTKLYVTSGKSHFYDFNRVLPSISKGIEVFTKQGVDPWFAQAILLIESPGRIQYSSVGAYGPFQLMKNVARKYGLKVNRKVDERKDFTKSAIGASNLLKKSCIPHAKRILTESGISYKESDLWFKLFVLHIYHAGAGNVGGLIKQMNPKNGGKELITTMWQTQFGGFKNASQNYSQVALASNFILETIIMENCESIYDCSAEIKELVK